MDFLQETKQKQIPEADCNSLVEFYDNLQQELKQRALRSYPDLKNLETDESGCALLPDDISENYRVIKVPEDGNCLYNCASIFLSGNENWKYCFRNPDY